MRNNKWILGFCLSFFSFPISLLAEETPENLSDLNVVGTISSNAGPSTASIVVFRDDKSGKTFIVPVGKGFVIDKSFYYLRSISQKSVILTDANGQYSLPFKEGRDTALKTKEVSTEDVAVTTTPQVETYKYNEEEEGKNDDLSDDIFPDTQVAEESDFEHIEEIDLGTSKVSPKTAAKEYRSKQKMVESLDDDEEADEDRYSESSEFPGEAYSRKAPVSTREEIRDNTMTDDDEEMDGPQEN